MKCSFGSRRRLCIGILSLISVIVLGMACAGDPGPVGPAGPTGPQGPAGPAANQSSATHSQDLVAVQGRGTGVVNVTVTDVAEGLTAQIDVNVDGAPPNTTFSVQRAPELGRDLGSDGICQRALRIDPWVTPQAPAFVSVPRPGPGPLVMLQTSSEGSGAVHIDFAAPGIADGTRFDLMFRLIDDLDNPTNELRSACFTVEAK